ncbi:MAG: sodium:solute symporter family protein [Myxococcales bacterium]|nr:sodium:solute symporter family protein [Myxococcales bacterium]MCB9754346.1 sodium:solute symporter family protein [Myxococcales bacterium]
MSTNATLLLVNLVYLAITLGIGYVAYRRTTAAADDYFLGGRTARTFVLFMALFGTNVTPFVLLGIPGISYHAGIGEFGRNAAIIALGIPLTFYLIGYPAYVAARAIGAITPAELYRERFGSPAVGLVLFLAYFVYTLPYMVTSVLGVGIAVDVLTGGALSLAVGAALILIITIAYTSLGGMRATMWTNVFQGTVFLTFIVLLFAIVARDHGGLAAATAAVQAHDPSLLLPGDRPQYQLGAFGSWGLAISLTVIGFPHIFVRLFTAQGETALKNVCRLYPIILLVLWLPAVLLGVWGAAEFPGLVGKASDRVFPLLVQRHVGPALQGVALAGVMAAVMSTLDAQALTLSSMLSRDVIRRYAPRLLAGERREVLIGRVFMIVLALIVFAVVLAEPASIFDIAKFSFSGYVTLVPTLYLGLRWRRFTAAGAIASIVGGNVALVLAILGWLPGLGLMPVAHGLVAAIALGVLVSLWTKPAPARCSDRVLGPIERAFGEGR